MNNLELSNKDSVEIREVSIGINNKSCLLLLITEEDKISVTSTYDIEFYKMYKKAAKKVKAGKLNCANSKTKELLELGIEKIYEGFDYSKEIYTEGANNYTYNKLCKLMKDAKEFQKISLYDWKCDYIRNLQSLGYELYTTSDDSFYVQIIQKKKKGEIILWEGINFEWKKYFAVNAYFSLLIRYFDSEKKTKLGYLNTSKEDTPDIEEPNIYDIDEKNIGVLIDHFEIDIERFTRQLVLPYDNFTEELDQCNQYASDEIEMLDYLCMEYLSYPRTEIKKRIEECDLIKQMENKKTTMDDNPKQKTKGKLWGLIGFKGGIK